MVGAFNPVASKLGQQDEGEGPFSPQDLKRESAESHPHYAPLGAPGQFPNSDRRETRENPEPMWVSDHMEPRVPLSKDGAGTGRADDKTWADRLRGLGFKWALKSLAFKLSLQPPPWLDS